MAASRHNQAVTLIEMLVVLGIILVLGGIAVTVTYRVDNQSKENALANAFTLLKSALREYYEATGGFPRQPEKIDWTAQTTPDAYRLALAKVTDHVSLMYQALRSVADTRQVLEKLSPTLVKTGTGGVPDLRDPWGTELDYIYVHNDRYPDSGDNFPELISAGPDRKFGTVDDISSKGRQPVK